MAQRSGPLAPVLGILLILFGIASFGFYVWGNAPMEEPASPGATPNPSKTAAESWWWRFTPLMIRLHTYVAIPAGVVGVVVGALLLLPLDSRRDSSHDS